MAAYIEYNKLVITTEPKAFHFDLIEDVNNNVKN